MRHQLIIKPNKMKLVKTLLAGIVFSTLLIACKKDNDTAPVFSIHGLWEGKIGSGSSTPSGQYALNIKSNGTIERISSNGAVSATGTWQLDGVNLTATYTYPGNGGTVTITASVDKAKNKIDGYWENTGNEDGTFILSKK